MIRSPVFSDRNPEDLSDGNPKEGLFAANIHPRPGIPRILPVLNVSILFEYFLYLLLHLMTLTTNAV